jgi:hypothetical protein
MDDLERWRDESSILSRTVYLNSNSLGVQAGNHVTSM